jgi:beta-glucosidase/6-phospho-beta-glucosidase/beta-galactosidase
VLATLDGYAVEGGFDGSREIPTCFGPAIHLGHVEGPGTALSLWDHYESILPPAAALGLDGLRLTVEWARLEPRQGERDHAALDRYRRLIVAATEMGLPVTAVFVDAAWPAWLGAEAWLLPWVSGPVIAHAEWVVHELGAHLEGVVPFARPTALVDDGFLFATVPPWRHRAAADANTAKIALVALQRHLSENPTVGPLLVGPYREVPALEDAGALGTLLSGCGEDTVVHLRSLVRGTGPTAGPGGLLEKVDGSFHPTSAAAALVRARS